MSKCGQTEIFMILQPLNFQTFSRSLDWKKKSVPLLENWNWGHSRHSLINIDSSSWFSRFSKQVWREWDLVYTRWQALVKQPCYYHTRLGLDFYLCAVMNERLVELEICIFASLDIIMNYVNQNIVNNTHHHQTIESDCKLLISQFPTS